MMLQQPRAQVIRTYQFCVRVSPLSILCIDKGLYQGKLTRCFFALLFRYAYARDPPFVKDVTSIPCMMVK
jgi:hypothetical protein